jgi:hypothetical protein
MSPQTWAKYEATTDLLTNNFGKDDNGSHVLERLLPIFESVPAINLASTAAESAVGAKGF